MLEFTQNHSTDLQLISQAILNREPMGFARFGDGEKATIQNRPYRADGWATFNNIELANKMSEAIKFDHPLYYVGISCPCCDPSSNRFYKRMVSVPKTHVTYANMFSNGNADVADEFLKNLLKEDIEILGCKEEATIRIAKNMVRPLVDPTKYLEMIENSSKDIVLLSAGPYSCILIHEYLARNHKPKTLIDVGSALDIIFGRRIRQYHKPNHPYRKRMCRNVI